MVPRQSAWQPLIEAVYAERASRIQRYAIKKEPWIFDREKLNNYAESIPEGYRLAPIDEKIYFETKKAESVRAPLSRKSVDAIEMPRA